MNAFFQVSRVPIQSRVSGPWVIMSGTGRVGRPYIMQSHQH